MDFHEFISVFFSLATVIALMLLSKNGWRLAEKIGHKRQRSLNDLSVEASLSLDAKRRLNVITWNRKRFLLLTGGTNDLLLEVEHLGSVREQT